MNVLKRFFDFYIGGSLHVAISVLSLVLMTNHMFRLPFDLAVAGFVFSGTVFGYNFIKFESLFRLRKPIRKQIKPIVALSGIALLVSVFFFFRLAHVTQVSAVIFFALAFLYAVPVFANVKNIRNLSGVKIYMVALCWAGVTTLLPVVNAEIEITSDVYLKFTQRFLLVIVLILVFEIIDLRKDDPALQTVPQKIGVKRTKILGLLLLVPFYFLEFLKIGIDYNQLPVNLALVVTTALFMIFAHPNRSKYYTSFWVESIPVFWYLAVLIV